MYMVVMTMLEASTMSSSTMSSSVEHCEMRLFRWVALGAFIGCGGVTMASAQSSAPVAPAASAKPAVMEKLSGVWVEGPGFDIKYGIAYDACAERCLANSTCVMIEYYRPQKKCNLYNTIRPRLAGGSSDVAIRR